MSIYRIDKLAETLRNLKKEFRGPASWDEPWIVSRADYDRLKKLLPEKDTLPILFPHRFGGLDIVVEEEYHGPPMPLSEWRNRK